MASGCGIAARLNVSAARVPLLVSLIERKDSAMSTMNMPPKRVSDQDTDPDRLSQRRSKDERYCLQVDRQTKASFSAMDDAEQAGRVIKKQNPVVRVTIYDAKDYTTKVIE